MIKSQTDINADEKILITPFALGEWVCIVVCVFVPV